MPSNDCAAPVDFGKVIGRSFEGRKARYAKAWTLTASADPDSGPLSFPHDLTRNPQAKPDAILARPPIVESGGGPVTPPTHATRLRHESPK
jgi:hypothetical protein